MRLTKQSSYAVRALMYCATKYPERCRVGDIAKAYTISELFLFKLIKPLVDGGLLQTTRGRNGGIQLARPAAEITLLEAIRLTEDNFDLAECFDSGQSDGPLVDLCNFNAALNKALEAFFHTLEGFTIADLVMPKNDVRRQLCLE